jgi:hypothetical protein
VLNPLDTGNTPTNGNLTYPAPSAAWKVNRATFSIPETAKAYWEIKISGDSTNNISCGVDTGLSSLTAQLGSTSAGWAIVPPNSTGSTSANKYNNGSSTSVTLPSNSGTNDVYMFAVDRNTNSIWVGINGNFVGTVGTSGQIFNNLPSTGTLFPAICTYNKLIDVNFGQQPFAYTPPTNYLALNTFNLPAPPSGIGTTAAELANKYMDITLYTGNGSTQSITNSGSMKPDWVWIKRRDVAASHAWIDSVRGIANQLVSNNTNAEATGCTDGITSLNSNGFSLGAGAIGYITNSNGNTFVAWQWRASNASAVSNTDGTITSTVSASTTAGFSIVTYTGNATSAQTVGHGLGVTPTFFILKSRGVQVWNVYSLAGGITGNTVLELNSDAAANTGGNISLTASSTTIGFGSASQVNGSGVNFVAYVFAPVAGYSAFGSYTGNGSSDGPFIYTGFRPRWLMIKNSSTTVDWVIEDTSRDPYNVAGAELFPNLFNAESSGNADLDILSNGFKPRRNSTFANGSGNTIIYMAFAESPFKYANAR